MKPRNANERRVVELFKTLQPIRQKDIDRMKWEYKYYYKGKGLSYFLVLERCEEFQVIRYYYMTSRSFFEFADVWINKDTKVIMAKNRFMGVDNWIRDSEITIKDWFHPHYDYTYLGGILRIPWSGAIVKSILPELKKRGMRKSTHNVDPWKFCYALLVNNRIETLLKVKQYRLVKFFIEYPECLKDDIWNSVRVALRHGYRWDSKQEVMDWCDMINDLNSLGLDTRNPHYICPPLLKEAHQHWLTRANLKRFLEREKERILAYEPIFKENRERFLDMLFKQGDLEIKVIPTAMGIAEEGAHMCHCVGGYYDRPESLILSAKVEGKRTETVEVSLSSYKVVQSRGVQNKETPYHQQIVELVNKNMKEIKKRNKLKKAV